MVTLDFLSFLLMQMFVQLQIAGHALPTFFCCFRLCAWLFSDQQTLHCSQPEHWKNIHKYFIQYFMDNTVSYALP